MAIEEMAALDLNSDLNFPTERERAADRTLLPTRNTNFSAGPAALAIVVGVAIARVAMPTARLTERNNGEIVIDNGFLF